MILWVLILILIIIAWARARCPRSSEERFQSDIVMTYRSVTDDVRETVRTHLNKEWDTVYTQEFILDTWGDQFFVLIQDGGFLGCVAIDDGKFISHLYVVKASRKKGIAKKLLGFAEARIRNQGYDMARLYCKKELIPYYQNHGYVLFNLPVTNHSNNTTVYIMSKPLNDQTLL